MRFIYFIIIVGAFNISCSSNKNIMEKASKINLLSVSSTEVESVLKDVRDAYNQEYEFTNQVFILRTEKVRDRLEVILSVYDVSDFSNCFQASLFPLYGLYKFEDSSVLVYGNDSQKLFKKKGEQIAIDLLECKKNKTEIKEGSIPYPPEIFEPIVWIYSGNSDKLTFREQAQFNIIE